MSSGPSSPAMRVPRWRSVIAATREQPVLPARRRRAPCLRRVLATLPPPSAAHSGKGPRCRTRWRLALHRPNKVFLGAMTLDLFAVLLGGATALLPIFGQGHPARGPGRPGLVRAAPSIGAFTMAWCRRTCRPGSARAACCSGRWWIRRRHGGVRTVADVLALVRRARVHRPVRQHQVVIRLTLEQALTPDSMRGGLGHPLCVHRFSNELGSFESGATARSSAHRLCGRRRIGTILWWSPWPSSGRRSRTSAAQHAAAGWKRPICSRKRGRELCQHRGIECAHGPGRFRKGRAPGRRLARHRRRSRARAAAEGCSIAIVARGREGAEERRPPAAARGRRKPSHRRRRDHAEQLRKAVAEAVRSGASSSAVTLVGGSSPGGFADTDEAVGRRLRAELLAALRALAARAAHLLASASASVPPRTPAAPTRMPPSCTWQHLGREGAADHLQRGEAALTQPGTTSSTARCARDRKRSASAGQPLHPGGRGGRLQATHQRTREFMAASPVRPLRTQRKSRRMRSSAARAECSAGSCSRDGRDVGESASGEQARAAEERESLADSSAVLSGDGSRAP